ncbi:Uncharacterised protein [Rothia dentocariosa]|uniref:Uncharacterized protein n=1 Tax=Rothia dentocariosa TaxID=2047 RepID=A0A448UYR0_9MICC|nr:Uncharacterised protein [Rothia dentocariosa]
MDGSGEATEIFSARSVDLTLGSKVAAGLQAGVPVAVEGVDGSFPSRLKVGASSEAPTFLLRCQPMFAEPVPFAAHFFTHRVPVMTLIASAHMRELPALLVAGSSCNPAILSRNTFRKN